MPDTNSFYGNGYYLEITPLHIRTIAEVGEQVDIQFNTANPINLEKSDATWKDILEVIERHENGIPSAKHHAFVIVTILDGVLVRTSVMTRATIERWAK